MLINLIKNEKPTHLAVAFDTSRQSFRTREYAEYKGNRGETPVEFKGQIPLLQDCPRGDEHPHARRRRTSRPTTSSRPSPRGACRAGLPACCVVLGRPRHHPARQRRRHAALPEHAGRLAAQALRHRRRDRALRHPARAVPRHRRARRRDERQPARHPEGRREDRRQVARPVRRPRRHPRARRRDQGRRRAEPARADRRTPSATARSTACSRDVELPVDARRPRAQPIDAQAVRDIFARLEFRRCSTASDQARRRASSRRRRRCRPPAVAPRPVPRSRPTARTRRR